MKVFNDLRNLFGLRHPLGLHDLDLPDSPAGLAQSAGPVSSGTEASTQRWSHTRVDGSAAPLEEAGAADHLRDQLTEILNQMTVIGEALTEVVAAVRALDPTPDGLAIYKVEHFAADGTVTDITDRLNQQFHGPRR